MRVCIVIIFTYKNEGQTAQKDFRHFVEKPQKQSQKKSKNTEKKSQNPEKIPKSQISLTEFSNLFAPRIKKT